VRAGPYAIAATALYWFRELLQVPLDRLFRQIATMVFQSAMLRSGNWKPACAGASIDFRTMI
jgi:hypothetical protein